MFTKKSISRVISVLLLAIMLLQFNNPAQAASISTDGFNPGAINAPFAMAVQPDGKILVGGWFTTLGGQSRSYIGRLNADGTLDTGFNPGADGFVEALAIQPDGKILVGGLFTNLGGQARSNLGRLNADGSLDTGFNSGADGVVLALAIQPDGKIVVGGGFTTLAGSTRNFIGRLNPNGSLDTGFNPGAGNPVRALAIQPDGKILVGGEFTTLGGSTRNHIGRLNGNGTLDTGLNPGANAAPYTFALQADGKILVGGDFTTLGGSTRNYIGRLNPDGTLDTGFNPGAGCDAYGIAVQPDGKILVGGCFANLGGQSRRYIGRLNTDGSLDTNFNPQADNTVTSLAVQPDDKILVGGWFTKLGGQSRSNIGRLYPDGTLDTDLNPGANIDVLSLAVQPNGKILVGGDFSTLGGSALNHIGRLNPDGSLDTSFNPDANGQVRQMVIQPDGKIVVGGDFTTLGGNARNYIGRLNEDGTLDSGFNPGADYDVYGMAIQPDGKILVGGLFTNLGGQSRNKIGRLNADGTLDTGFDPEADSTVQAFTIQPDGKIVVGGGFTMIAGSARNYIARLNADGSLDTSFNPGAEGAITALAIQPDGKIIVAGQFTTLGGQSRSNIGRLNADGSLDTSFNPGANDLILSLAVQSDGKIVAGGLFTNIAGGTRSHIARLNTDGTLDTGFDPGADSNVIALAIQSDGKIVVGGVFSMLGGSPRSSIGRLSSDTAALQNLTSNSSGTTLTWARSGSGPEVSYATFESSTDGVTYTPLGAGTRIAGGWQLTGLDLPQKQNLFIRARGYYAAGFVDGSGSAIESVRNIYLDNTPHSFIISSVSTGGDHTCGLKSDGTLACWGDNTYGQSTPPAGTFIQVSAGGYHTCGLKSDSTIACWGSNDHGQSTPPAGTFTQVSAGMHHTCGLKSDGTIVCWGEDLYGESSPPVGTFTQISAGGYHTCGVQSDGTIACWGQSYNVEMPPAGSFAQVSAGHYHTCGLKSDGTMACWGDNDGGESSPPSYTFVQISAGYYFTCGVMSDGTLACWGDNTYGQSTPPTGTFTQVSAGGYHACALKSDGTLVCWGDNSQDQANPLTISGNAGMPGATLSYTDGFAKTATADGSGNYSLTVDYNWSGAVIPSLPGYTFVPANRPYTNVLANQTGQNYTATAINTISGNAGEAGVTLSYTDGTPKTATSASNGSYSFTVSYNWTGTVTPSKLGYTFSPVNRPYTDVLANQTGQDYTATFSPSPMVSAGFYQSCLLKSDGTIGCWGTDYDGSTTAPSGTFIQVSTGYSHSCGLKSDGTLACWGAGTTNTGSYPDFGQSIPPSGTFTQVSASEGHTCGLKTDGTIVCWGSNDHGQSTPPDGTFTAVSAGDAHTCGVKSDGTVACWGNNAYGETAAPSGTFTQVSTGEFHTCGLKSDGTIACWGWNYYGQSTPPSGTFTQISAGYFHTCGLRSDGTLACWGDNTYGQSTPPAGTFTQVSAGTQHTCGLESDGSLICWGDNTYRQVDPFTISGNAGVAGATLSYTDAFAKTATADSSGNYSLAVDYNWSGTVTPSKTGYTFAPDHKDYSNITTSQTQDYIATLNTYTLTYAAVTGGTISGTSPQTVNYGASGTAVTATPNTGYHFVHWSDAVATASRTDTDVTANVSVTANFAVDIHTLTFAAGSNGSITAPTTTSPTTHNYGDVVTITAVPNTGYHFVNWTGDVSTVADVNAASSSITINGDYSITANFAIETHTLTYTPATGGSITAPATSPTTHNYGDVLTITAVPNTGYHFVNWTGDTAGIADVNSPSTSITMDGDYSITANFATNTFILDYGAGSNGSISGTAHQTDVAYGTDGSTVAAVPNPGYHFVNWSDSSTDNPRTDTDVTADVSVTANFAINTYTLTYNAGTGGTIMGTTPQTVIYGASGTAVSAVPNAGYNFVNWSDSSTANPRTDSSVSEDVTVTANFAQNEYTLTISSANGTVAKNPDQATYHDGDIVQLAATPNTGWTFANWTGDLNSSTNPDHVTIHGNTSVTANYTPISVPAAFNKSSPTNSTTNGSLSLELSWSASSGATSYEYCLDTTNDNACSGTWISTGTNTSADISALNPGTTYYWQVHAINAGGTIEADNGTWWSFTTASTYTISGSLGPGGANATLTYTGGSTSADGSGNYTFTVQSGWSGTVTTPLLIGYTFLPTSRTYSNITADQIQQNYIATTVVISASLPVTRLLAPKIQLLSNNAMPSFNWASSPSADHYELVLASDSAFTQVVNAYSVSQTNLTLTMPLTNGRYFWRVRSVDLSNQPGRWSLSRFFTIDITPPSPPVLRSPTNGATVNRMPIFRWTPYAPSVRSQFECDNDADFSSPECLKILALTQYRTASLPAGTYFWRVRTQDPAGNWSAWSSAFTITVLP